MINEYQRAHDAMQQAFERAAEMHPDKVSEMRLVLGGKTVQMRIVGTRLAERLRLPFCHLESNDGSKPPRLTIDFWDGSETGIACPVGAAVMNDLGNTPVTVARSADDRLVFNKLRQSITCLDRKARHVVGWSANPGQFSLYESGRPLHSLLNVWHFDHDMPLIHAGLISKNGTGVLFAGSSGAGKTTSSLTCLYSGFNYLSEDQVALQQTPDGSFHGHSLYNSTFLKNDHLGRFPLLAAHAIAGIYPDEEKHLVLLAQLFPMRMGSATRIRTVALPRIVKDSTSRIRAASKAEALLAIAPSSLIVGQLTSGVRGFNKLTELVKNVPCFWLELGSNINDIPLCVERMLANA
jgi:hypothetical protein